MTARHLAYLLGATGCAALTYGAYLWSHAAGWIVGGFVLFAVAANMLERAKKPAPAAPAPLPTWHRGVDA
jgi:hypothetical protein